MFWKGGRDLKAAREDGSRRRMEKTTNVGRRHLIQPDEGGFRFITAKRRRRSTPAWGEGTRRLLLRREKESPTLPGIVKTFFPAGKKEFPNTGPAKGKGK